MDKGRDLAHLNREVKLDLVRALYQRGPERFTLAEATFRKVYPTAPQEMINAAVHHVYDDGADAALDFIAGSEMFLRDPNDEWVGYGVTYELLYHAYNWHMFLTLLPEGTQGLLDTVDDLKKTVESGVDKKEILKAIEELRDQLVGHLGLPNT